MSVQPTYDVCAYAFHHISTLCMYSGAQNSIFFFIRLKHSQKIFIGDKKSPTVFTTNHTELIKNGTCLITKPLSLCVNRIAPALGGKIHYLFDVSLYVYQFIVAAFHFPF